MVAAGGGGKGELAGLFSGFGELTAVELAALDEDAANR